MKMRHPGPAESGQVTAEYAVGTLGAVGIAAAIVSPPWWLWESGVRRWLTDRVCELPLGDAAGPLLEAVRWPW